MMNVFLQNSDGFSRQYKVVSYEPAVQVEEWRLGFEDVLDAGKEVHYVSLKEVTIHIYSILA
jgi:hypothetical protein